MKHNIFQRLLIVLMIFFATSPYAMEEYDVDWIALEAAFRDFVKVPNQKNSEKISELLPGDKSASHRIGSYDSEVAGRILNNLNEIEKLIESGNQNALQVAFTLYAISDGEYSEWILEMTGEAIIDHPKAYLIGAGRIRAIKKSFGNDECTFAQFLDWEKYKNYDSVYAARRRAIQTVTDHRLEDIKACVMNALIKPEEEKPATKAAYHEQLLLGVAEEPDFKDIYGKGVVRAMFAKPGEEWIVLSSSEKVDESVPPKALWYLAFDGKKLGELHSIDNIVAYDEEPSWKFMRDRILSMEDVNEFPLLGNKESRFRGWEKLPENRPIVAVSRQNYQDTEKWKKVKLGKKDVEALYPLVKEKIPNPRHCNGDPSWDRVEIDMTMDDVGVYRSYKNTKGDRLVSIGISEFHVKNCRGDFEKSNTPMSFYIADGIQFLGFGLDLVDAGDYDADGEVEFVFWYSGNNTDGYTLYESSFKKRFDYHWSYH